MNDDDYWRTRSGRWRIRLSREQGGSLAERLYRVIGREVEEGHLPAKAIVPPIQRVVTELRVARAAVEQAYESLTQAGLFERRSDGVLVVADRDDSADVGTLTQIRFEKSLYEAARAARDMGLSPNEATGRFKNLFQTLNDTDEAAAEEPDSVSDPDPDDDAPA